VEMNHGTCYPLVGKKELDMSITSDQMSSDVGAGSPRVNEEEAWEDYQDYCAAAAALDEALLTGEITPLEDLIRELGLEKECGV
jgi:hypothetical protein